MAAAASIPPQPVRRYTQAEIDEHKRVVLEKFGNGGGGSAKTLVV
jgi:hypothetical protein